MPRHTSQRSLDETSHVADRLPDRVAWCLAFSAAGELKVGDSAPNFTLRVSDGRTYTLTDFKGKRAVVLAWFPKAYTHGCTLECKSL